MNHTPQGSLTPEPPPSGGLIGILSVSSLLGAALFFSGYVYRWAYFSYFLIDIAQLNFPAETYPIMPVQVFCGTPGLVLRTIIFVLITAIVVRFALWGLQNVETCIQGLPNLFHGRFRSLMVRLAELPDALSTLLREVIIVIGILIMLFWVSRWQGIADARRDAYNDTSTLPTIAFVMPDSDKQNALGRPLLGSTVDPSLSGFRYFGDRTLFDSIFRKEDSDVKDSRIWHILLAQEKWIYLFGGMSRSPGKKDERPLVVGIQQTEGGQQMILGPSQPRN